MSHSCIINGKLCSSDTLPFFIPGYSVFETLLVDDGAVEFIAEHVERITASLNKLGVDISGVTESKLLNDIKKILAISDSVKTSTFRCRYTCGRAQYDSSELLSTVELIPYERPDSDCILSSVDYKVNEYSAVAGLKSTSYANYAVSLSKARAGGADEALMLNTSDFLCECATSNVFFISDDCIHTPSLVTGCLPGIVRDKVIGICADRGVSITEGEYKMSDIMDADAVFITNSLRGMMAVQAIDGYKFKMSPLMNNVNLLFEKTRSMHKTPL